jgi:DNA-binding response OmpR family regulator
VVIANRRPRALVVEDEAPVRDLWCEFLRMLGCDAVQTATGVEGLASFDEGGYDILVTDLLMPGLNGWEVAWTVRRRDPSVGIIVISGSSTTIDLALLREPGVILLEKPVDLGTFRKAVEESLVARQREAERHSASPA